MFVTQHTPSRWAIKIFPFIPSELLADALELAIQAREVDMRASPYDLSMLREMKRFQDAEREYGAFNLEPIKIETREVRP